MQKTPVNTVPPRMVQQTKTAPSPAQNRPGEGTAQAGASPALQLAARIRNEQGKERLQQFLLAMEPFLAPAERSHIASKLGVPLPERQTRAANDCGGTAFKAPADPQNPFAAQQGADPLQMMQLLSGLGTMVGKGNMGKDQLALAQLLGSMMGNRQK